MAKITTKEHQAYMPGSQGPFRCDHCEYFSGTNRCNNKKIVAYAINHKFGLELESAGFAKVDPAGCSDEFKKK